MLHTFSRFVTGAAAPAESKAVIINTNAFDIEASGQTVRYDAYYLSGCPVFYRAAVYYQ